VCAFVSLLPPQSDGTGQGFGRTFMLLLCGPFEKMKLRVTPRNSKISQKNVLVVRELG